MSKAPNPPPDYPKPPYHTGNLDSSEPGTVDAREKVLIHTGNLDSSEPGTAARANKNKTPFHFVPLHLLDGVARVLEFGAKKYAKWNWVKGTSHSLLFDCAQRHLLAWYYLREDCDHETGLNHIDHAITNLLMIKNNMINNPPGDDRPTGFKTSPIESGPQLDEVPPGTWEVR